MTRAVQWYMGLGVCDQRFVIYRSRSEVNPAVAVHGHFRYYRLRLITRDPLVADPQTYIYTTGRPTSRAIQWYTGILVCDHWVVSYAPITVAPDPPGCLTETDIEPLLEIRWS